MIWRKTKIANRKAGQRVCLPSRYRVHRCRHRSGTERAAGDAVGQNGRWKARPGRNGFIGLAGDVREAFWAKVTELGADRPAVRELRRRDAFWMRPEMRVAVNHLKGSGGLRHATVQTVMDGIS